MVFSGLFMICGLGISCSAIFSHLFQVLVRSLAGLKDAKQESSRVGEGQAGQGPYHFGLASILMPSARRSVAAVNRLPSSLPAMAARHVTPTIATAEARHPPGAFSQLHWKKREGRKERGSNEW